MLTDETVLTRLGYYCISWPGERVFYVDSIFPARTAVGEKLALHPPRLVV